MEEFAVRPGHDPAARPLIEFRGDHRSAAFPSVHLALRAGLHGFVVTKAAQPAPDDFLWTCECVDGAFEISAHWGGLFITPLGNHEAVADRIASALVRSGKFRRVPWWGAGRLPDDTA